MLSLSFFWIWVFQLITLPIFSCSLGFELFLLFILFISLALFSNLYASESLTTCMHNKIVVIYADDDASKLFLKNNIISFKKFSVLYFDHNLNWLYNYLNSIFFIMWMNTNKFYYWYNLATLTIFFKSNLLLMIPFFCFYILSFDSSYQTSC